MSMPPNVPADLLIPRAEDPPWLVSLLHALKLDTREVPGEGINPYIRGLYETLGLNPEKFQDDSHPWCAICANAQIKRAGFKPWPQLHAARGMLAWGMPVTPMRRGAWVCLNRVDPKEPTVPHGHATCCLGLADEPGWFFGIGGNQHNRIEADAYELSRVVGMRLPLARL